MTVKRTFDFLVALGGTIVLLPIFAVIALWIELDSPGSILFAQTRIGKWGRPFKIYKFRTMVTNAETLGKQITTAGDSRITRSGQFLRKYKLDELPQLLNVLKGDMSLVGPRPEVPRYVDLYTIEQRRVLNVRPGITDLASLEFRNENDILARVENPEDVYIQDIMPRKLNLNLQYIACSSFFFDINLVFKTFVRVVAV